MKSRIALFAALGLLAFAVLMTTLQAFVLLNPPRKWFQGAGGGPNDLPVLFEINSGGEESIGDADNGVTAVRNATSSWEDELNVNLISTSTTTLNNVSRDGRNVTSFNDPARIVRNALAVTVVGWYDGGQSETVNGIDFARFDDADTSFSKKSKFTTQALGSCNGEYDIEAVQAHEIGHALGLDHSASGAALMFASVSSCSFKRINSDDSNGINTIYNPNFGGGNPCTPASLSVSDHSCSTPNRGNKCLIIAVAVVDDCGDPVSGASVTVQLDGQEAGDVLTGTASTGSGGTVSFSLRCRDASSSTYTSTVTNVSGSVPWTGTPPQATCTITR